MCVYYVLTRVAQPHGNAHEARVDRRSLHGGCDVLAGDKWAANKWVYNRKWEQRGWVDTTVDGMARLVKAPRQQRYADAAVAADSDGG